MKIFSFKFFPYLSLFLSVVFLTIFPKNIYSFSSSDFKYIDILGNKIRYIQKGSGRDVVLVHGLPGSIEDWEPVFDELTKNFRVTALDRPGHGLSSADNIKATVGQNAQTVVNLTKKLNLKNVILVGHSYGGATILRVATMNPDNINAYLSIAGVADPNHKGPKFILRIVAIPWLGKGLAAVFLPFVGKSMVEDGLKEAFYPNDNFLTKDIIEKREKLWLNTKVVTTMAREHVKMDDGVRKTFENYGKIVKPLYIIQGEEDKLVNKSEAELLHNKVKDSKLFMLKNTSHMVQFVRPEFVIKIINEINEEVK